MNLEYLNAHAEMWMDAIEEVEDLTAGEQLKYLAAMLDGKRFTIPTQFISDESKYQAAMYEPAERVLLLAANWDNFK